MVIISTTWSTSQNDKQEFPVKMTESVNATLASSHDHIKITTKLQNNNNWESPKV